MNSSQDLADHTILSDETTFAARYSWIFEKPTTTVTISSEKDITVSSQKDAVVSSQKDTILSSAIGTADSSAKDAIVSPEKEIIKMTEINTPLGLMLAGATSKSVCLLEFTSRIRIEREFEELKKLLNAVMIPGRNEHLNQLEKELSAYFDGSLKIFTVPLHIPGNDFSQAVWKAIQEVTYGQTCTYKQQADKMNNPKAIRAIASTNGRNRIAIIIPCHRIIGSNGSMTGYAGGVDKKKWLLKFERSNSAVPEGSLF